MTRTKPLTTARYREMAWDAVKSAGWILRKIKAITDAVPGITRMR